MIIMVILVCLCSRTFCLTIYYAGHYLITADLTFLILFFSGQMCNINLNALKMHKKK